MNELKPCPFCGAQVKLMAIAGEPYPPTYEVNLGTVSEDSDDICYVHCPTCGANWHIEVRVDAFPMDTIAAWNRRPAPENKPLTLEQLSKLTNDDWVWVEFPELDKSESLWHRAKRLYDVYSHENYGKTWIAYARKPEQEENYG